MPCNKLHENEVTKNIERNTEFFVRYSFLSVIFRHWKQVQVHYGKGVPYKWGRTAYREKFKLP